MTLQKFKLEDLRNTNKTEEIELDWSKIAQFVNDNEQTEKGLFYGRIPAKVQRELFNGLFIGKGKLSIDTQNKTIFHYVKVCFGQDCEYNVSISPIEQATEPQTEETKHEENEMTVKQIQDITRTSFYFNDATYTITQLIYKSQCKYEILYEGRRMASLSTVEDVAHTIHKCHQDGETFESILSDLQEAFTGAQTMYQPLTIRQIQNKIKKHSLAMAQYPDATDWHRDQIISLTKELANLVKAKANMTYQNATKQLQNSGSFKKVEFYINGDQYSVTQLKSRNLKFYEIYVCGRKKITNSMMTLDDVSDFIYKRTGKSVLIDLTKEFA